MPTNHTTNYQLSQWERTDKVQMEDFNADNAKIDAALKAEADARTAETSALTEAVAKLGNCQIYATSYVGTGTGGSSNARQIIFPKAPLVAFIAGNKKAYASFRNCNFFWGTNEASATWSNGGRTLTWYSYNGNVEVHMNSANTTYQVIALYPAES